MEIELLEKKDHPLLSRIEVSFKIMHPNESTPKRSDVRDGLAEHLNVKKGCVVIDNMKAVFGKSETLGFAKIYSNEKDAKDIEHKHILIRNSLATADKEKKEKKEKKKENE
jgi:ribosomal protein S24E